MTGIHHATTLCLCLILMLPLDAYCSAPAAFLSEAAGEVVISLASGSSQRGLVGAQLAAGDTVRVARGKAVVVYLSGTMIDVEPGPGHVVGDEAAKASPLLARIGATLGEMAAPGNSLQGPAVHGMARDLAIGRTRPANTLLLDPAFEMTWSAAEGADSYVLTVTAPGEEPRNVTVSDTALAAAQLQLQPGLRYSWQVQAQDGLLPRSSALSWIEVATDSTRAKISLELELIAKASDGAGQAVMQAALLFERQCYADSERLLSDAAAMPGMSYPTRALLKSVRAAMAAPAEQ